MWNKEQLEAINSTDGATMVVASAGAGKSSVLCMGGAVQRFDFDFFHFI